MDGGKKLGRTIMSKLSLPATSDIFSLSCALKSWPTMWPVRLFKWPRRTLPRIFFHVSNDAHLCSCTVHIWSQYAFATLVVSCTMHNTAVADNPMLLQCDHIPGCLWFISLAVSFLLPQIQVSRQTCSIQDQPHAAHTAIGWNNTSGQWGCLLIILPHLLRFELFVDTMDVNKLHFIELL